jgi:hypothetical protein
VLARLRVDELVGVIFAELAYGRLKHV